VEVFVCFSFFLKLISKS